MPQIRDPRKCCFSRTACRIVAELCTKVAHYATERAPKKRSEKNIAFLRKSTFCAQKLHATERAREKSSVSRELPRRSWRNYAQKLHTMPPSEHGKMFREKTYNFEKINFFPERTKQGIVSMNNQFSCVLQNGIDWRSQRNHRNLAFRMQGRHARSSLFYYTGFNIKAFT